MPRYLIERYFAEGITEFLAGKPVKSIVETNSETEVVWLHSYVTEGDRRVYCLCEAASPEAVRKAARRAGLPVDAIHLVTVLDPHTHPH